MIRFIDSILIPTDGSEGALAGAKRGIALASRTDAEVHVLSVVESRAGPLDLDDATLSALESEAEAAVESIVQAVRDHDEELAVTTAVTSGTPFQTIREYASRHEIDVVAMGTTGRTGLDRVLLGSVTENVLRTARTPVLAVPPNAGDATIDDAAFERLLLPTDGSGGAEIAVEWGIELANALESTVDTLYSVDPGPFSGIQEPDEIYDALERRGEEAIETVRDRARDAGVSVSASITSGSPASVILTYASDNDVDLIVMGTHGRTGIGQWFLGSVTENVVRQADVPVFCVPVSAETP